VKGDAGTVLRWPLWSWRNLAVTTAVVLLLFYGMGRVVEPAKITFLNAGNAPALAVATPSPLLPSGPSAAALSTSPDPTAPTPTRTTPTAPTGTSATTAAPTTKSARTVIPGAPSKDSVTAVALSFAQAWSSSARSQQEWALGIQPYVTPALGAGLAQTDPARVPATRVTGEPLLLTSSATSATVRVPTDGGSIVVTLTRAAGGWQVSGVAPADQPPGAPVPDLQQPTTAKPATAKPATAKPATAKPTTAATRR
jgi:hypothetical protein